MLESHTRQIDIINTTAMKHGRNVLISKKKPTPPVLVVRSVLISH